MDTDDKQPDTDEKLTGTDTKRVFMETQVTLVPTVVPQRKMREMPKNIFKAGNSFGTIKKTKGVVELIRKKTKDGKLIVEMLWNIANGLDPVTGVPQRWGTKMSDRMKALDILEKRFWGLPKQTIEADVRGVVMSYTDMLALLEAQDKTDGSTNDD